MGHTTILHDLGDRVKLEVPRGVAADLFLIDGHLGIHSLQSEPGVLITAEPNLSEAGVDYRPSGRSHAILFERKIAAHEEMLARTVRVETEPGAMRVRPKRWARRDA